MKNKVLIMAALLLLAACGSPRVEVVDTSRDLPQETAGFGYGKISSFDRSTVVVNVSVPDAVDVGQYVPFDIQISLLPDYFPEGDLIEGSVTIDGILSAGTDSVEVARKINVPPKTSLTETGYTVKNVNNVKCVSEGFSSLQYQLHVESTVVSQHRTTLTGGREIVARGPSRPIDIIVVSPVFRCVRAHCGTTSWNESTNISKEDGYVQYDNKGSCVQAEMVRKERRDVSPSFKSLRQTEYLCRSPADEQSLQTTRVTQRHWGVDFSCEPSECHLHANFDNLVTNFRSTSRDLLEAHNVCTSALMPENVLNPEDSGDIAVALCDKSTTNGTNLVAYEIKNCDDILKGSTCVHSGPTADSPASCRIP